jgi:predicted component of type VI protein secretion system
MPLYEKLSKKADGTYPLADSIARNLEAVLNAKEGYSAAVEVFGIGRYDGHYGHKEQIDTLTAELLQKVKLFELRVKEPSIVLIGRYRGLWVLFRLTGRCNEQPCSFELFFHSIFRNVRVMPS